MSGEVEKDFQEIQIRMASLMTGMGEPVLKLLDPKPGERILDMGCGLGVLAEEMVKMGCEVVAIDVNSQAVEATRQRNVDARLMNAEAMTFRDEFDAVFSNASLHWMRHANRAIEGGSRALKKGGRFVGETGDRNNLKNVIAAVQTALERRGIEIENLHPWIFYTHDSLTGLIENHGMKLKSMETLERPTTLPGTVSEWMSVYANNYLSCLHPKEREAFLDELMELARPTLFRDGKWFADYVRLRFHAVKS